MQRSAAAAQPQQQQQPSAIKTAASLWWSGVCDALQMQRCIVFCVLDGSGVILVGVLCPAAEIVCPF
jgi:hypothetical protein